MLVKYLTMLAMIVTAFYLGQYVHQQNVLEMAYLSGQIYTVNGPKACMPMLDASRTPYWNCSQEPRGIGNNIWTNYTN